MIYVVSGHMRTGTSLMMQALESGGMRLAYDKERDIIIEQTGDDDYKANPKSLYEIDFSKYYEKEFPQKYDGKVIKVFHFGLPYLKKGLDYTVIFMKRNFEEMRQSFAAMSAKMPKRWEYSIHDAEGYNLSLDRSIEKLHELKARVAIIDYLDVVSNPISTFDSLSSFGFPINATQAASVVNPAWYRFRREELIEGVKVA